MRTNNSVRAVIVRGSEVLLIHRRKLGKEYFVTPGGGVEEGETFEEALTREIMEETNLKLVGSQLWYQNEDNGTQFYYYICKTEGDEVRITGEENDRNTEDNWYHPEWVEVSKLAGLDVYPLRLRELGENDTIRMSRMTGAGHD